MASLKPNQYFTYPLDRGSTSKVNVYERMHDNTVAHVATITKMQALALARWQWQWSLEGFAPRRRPRRMARVSPGVSDETLAALGALADAAAVQPAAPAQPVALTAAQAADAPTGAQWTPRMLETVYVRGWKTPCTVIDQKGGYWNVESADGTIGGLFTTAELAPVDAPALTPAPAATSAVERAVAADGVAREPEPLAECEAWVRSTDVAESTFVEIVLDVDDPCLQTMLDLERSAKRVRVRVYASADDAGAEGE